MVARSVVVDEIHGNIGGGKLPEDGAWEPVDYIPKCVKGYWSELGRYLQDAKARINDLD